MSTGRCCSYAERFYYREIKGGLRGGAASFYGVSAADHELCAAGRFLAWTAAAALP